MNGFEAGWAAAYILIALTGGIPWWLGLAGVVGAILGAITRRALDGAAS